MISDLKKLIARDRKFKVTTNRIGLWYIFSKFVVKRDGVKKHNPKRKKNKEGGEKATLKAKIRPQK